jgi:hypothetical protein
MYNSSIPICGSDGSILVGSIPAPWQATRADEEKDMIIGLPQTSTGSRRSPMNYEGVNARGRGTHVDGHVVTITCCAWWWGRLLLGYHI